MNKILAFIFWFLICLPAFSQDKGENYDSSYYVELQEHMVLRLYYSKKYTDLVIGSTQGSDSYTYLPNSGNNLGIGFTYQNFTLNLAGPFSFLNPNRQKDFPKYIDLQVHIYPQKMIIDLFGQFYDGYTLAAEQLQNSDQNYLRKDIKVRKIGANYNYLFQGDKLSLEASLNQSSIQKKSAASLMAGFEVYGGSIKGDSLILPSIENQREINFKESSYFQFGPNVGAAGTLVFGGGFFLTGVASAGLNLGTSGFNNGVSQNKFGLVPSYLLRGFLGYNGEKFSINANYVYKNNRLIRQDPFQTDLITGNYRINIVYKIRPSEKFKNGFNKINPIKLIEKVLN